MRRLSTGRRRTLMPAGSALAASAVAVGVMLEVIQEDRQSASL